jgi:small conductance mechanosensitive channel
MLLVFRPFSVGDKVTVAGVTGSVDEIGLFTTSLDSPDNRRFVVPNSEIFGSTIENYTHHDTRRVDVAVGTDYDADLAETRSVLERAAGGLDAVRDEPAPQIYLDELGGSSINWSVRVWADTDDYWSVREDLTRAVKDGLDDAGIGIPYPNMDVHVDGWLESTGA